jgi:hypothetical protein
MDPSTIDRQQRDAADNSSSYRVEYLKHTATCNCPAGTFR